MQGQIKMDETKDPIESFKVCYASTFSNLWHHHFVLAFYVSA
jgi:hypothetical protein